MTINKGSTYTVINVLWDWDSSIIVIILWLSWKINDFMTINQGSTYTVVKV